MTRAQFHLLIGLAGWLMMGVGTAVAQDGVRVSWSGEAAVSVEAGGVGTRLVQIVNGSDEATVTRLIAKMPSGWTLLIPPPNVNIAGGGRASQLVSFQVPASTNAGEYEVELLAEGFSENSATLTVRVLSSLSIQAEWIETQPFVRAGGGIKALFSVTNDGNAPVVVQFSGRSSLEYGVQTSPNELSLSVGEAKQVEVSVATQEDISGRLTHSLVVEAAIEGSIEGAGTVPPLSISFVSDILPVKQAITKNREGVLPVRLGFSASTEEGRQAGQIELDLPQTKVGNKLYEALVRIPDIRDASVFAYSDQYTFRMSTPFTTIRLGDHQFSSTDLLESGSLGFGAGVEVNRAKISSGIFAQQSRKTFPERQQAGAFVHFRPRPSIQLEANVLAKRSYEEGTLFSVAAELRPGTTNLRAEYAMGWSDSAVGNKQRRGEAIELAASSTYKNSSFSANADWANDAFLGTIQNTRGGSGAFTLTLTEWLRLHGQSQIRQRFYDLNSGSTAQQTSATTQAGITLTNTGINRAFLTFSTTKQINENTLSALKRDDLAFELRAGYNRRRMGLSSTVVRGQAEDGLQETLKPYYSGAATVFSSFGQFSFNVFGSYLQGPTFYNPHDQERIMLGGSIGWDSNKGTQLHGSVFKSLDLAFDQQEFLLGDVRLIHHFSFGHDVILRARLAKTAADASIRDGTFGVTYRIPIYVPAPGAPGKRDQVVGQVVDAETGKPIPDVILSLDSKSFSTDSDGRFSVYSPLAGSSYLSIDRMSIGLERRPIGEFPIQILADAPGRQPLLIQVVRSSRISARITFDGQTSADRTAALSKELGPEAVAGIVVEAQNGAIRIRRLTSSTGEAQFADMVPGDWSLFAVGSTLPNGYKTKPDTVHVTIVPGGVTQTEFAIKPVSRGIQLVSSGSATLGSGIKISSGNAVALIRPSPEQNVEKLASADSVAIEADQSMEVQGVHVVQPGETLSMLARRYYQSTLHWVRLWRANTAVIGHPDVLLPGVRIEIPPTGRLTKAEVELLKKYATSQN